jgi:hypothetical protein
MNRIQRGDLPPNTAPQVYTNMNRIQRGDLLSNTDPPYYTNMNRIQTGDLPPDTDPPDYTNMNCIQRKSASVTKTLFHADDTAAVPSFSWEPPAETSIGPDKKCETMEDKRTMNVDSFHDRMTPLLELLCYSGDNDIESCLTRDIDKNKYLGTKIDSSNKERANDEEDAEDRQKENQLRGHVNSEILALLDFNYTRRSDEENLVCFICCEAFYERVHLKNHLVNLHLRHIPIPQFARCPLCPFVCKSRYQFVDHVLKSKTACRSLMMRKKDKGHSRSKSSSNKER